MFFLFFFLFQLSQACFTVFILASHNKKTSYLADYGTFLFKNGSHPNEHEFYVPKTIYDDLDSSYFCNTKVMIITDQTMETPQVNRWIDFECNRLYSEHCVYISS